MCYTYAVFSILTGNESFVTNAVVSVIGVDALAIFTNSFLLAFVCFAAFVSLFVSLLLSGWAVGFNTNSPARSTTLFLLACLMWLMREKRVVRLLERRQNQNIPGTLVNKTTFLQLKHQCVRQHTWP